MLASEIRVKIICVNQGLGVHNFRVMKLLYEKSVKDLPLPKHDYIHLTSKVTG